MLNKSDEREHPCLVLGLWVKAFHLLPLCRVGLVDVLCQVEGKYLSVPSLLRVLLRTVWVFFFQMHLLHQLI